MQREFQVQYAYIVCFLALVLLSSSSLLRF